jgi:tetratricopeptide (TPR) repeat protein/transcriptional regulator with XRE-family HTH domain
VKHENAVKPGRIKGVALSHKAQIEFIRTNQNLSVEELSSRTGLSRHRVEKIMERLRQGSQTPPAAQENPYVADYRLLWIIAFIPVILAFLSYMPVFQNQFVEWDDDSAIQENIHLYSLSWQSIKWMFTTFYSGNWIPLNWLSLSLDYHLGGLNPVVYHLHNLLLHVLNTLLVFFLSMRVFVAAQTSGVPQGKKKPAFVFLTASFFSALLFGIHPIHVESVAWAAERKDLLCALFFLLSLLMYMDYGSSAVQKSWKRYACFGLFLLALMSKPMAITLPLVLLLLDMWPLARFSRNRVGILVEKIPFFAVSFFSAWLTLFAQSKAIARWTLEKLPADFRIMNAFHSIIFYLGKMLVPVRLSAFYPIPAGHEAFSAINIAACILVLLISAICLRYYKLRPYIAAAWLYYIIMLVPVLGIIQVGSQVAADRYTYLPCLGPLMFLAAIPASLFSGRKLPVAVLGLVLSCCLGLKTAGQARIWHDSISLWENAARISPGVSWIIHSNLANAYRQDDRLDDAINEYKKAIAIDSLNAVSHDGFGVALAAKGLTQDAIREFKTAISLNPMFAPLHYNLSDLYSRLGQYNDAIFEIQEAIKIKPKDPIFHNSLATILAAKGLTQDAIKELKNAISLNPMLDPLHYNLFVLYSRLKQYNDAIFEIQEAVRIKPENPIYWYKLGNTYLLKGMFPEAVAALEKAVELQPQNPEIYKKLEEARQQAGKHQH